MRDRALAMKWAEEFVVAGNNEEALTVEFTKRGVKQSTVKDQLRRLKRCGLLPEVESSGCSILTTSAEKPFAPVPKNGKSKKGKV